MQNNSVVQFVCVEDPHAEQERQKILNRSIWGSVAVTLIAICLVAWTDNHYREKLRDARQFAAMSCQAGAKR
ncbi:hypothetical protein [Cupriavidus pinatubonensis]|uniref:Uncharacterized protein n=1 Tax=Cupriavidus pinatubonensis TaxID=248026 RepID=A0ABM8WQT4_9BURK|nr:hypothetical protein [Cupriavidus pinatubonensis]CAG9169801.1 hypothetical protein LMG23994_01670 [Cupriavidus pinatubonensis]